MTTSGPEATAIPQAVKVGAPLLNRAREHIKLYSECQTDSPLRGKPLSAKRLDYQASRAAEAAFRLRGPGCIVLQDPTGTGKTVVALVAAKLLLDAPRYPGGEKVDRVLVIAPNKTIARLWEERAARAGFADDDIKIQLIGKLQWGSKPRLLIVPRSAMPKPLLLAGRQRLLVVVDEAHRGLQNANNPGFNEVSGIAADARVLLVTATPFQLSASGFAQMLEIATHKAEIHRAQKLDRIAIEEYTEALVSLLRANYDLSETPKSTRLLAAQKKAFESEAAKRPQMDTALKKHMMSRYDREEMGLPELAKVHVPAREPVFPGAWSVFFHIARLLPELTCGVQSSDSFLRMLASSHEAFRASHVFREFERQYPDGRLLEAIAAVMEPGPLSHPKIEKTAKWVADRLAAGRHVLVFCVYVQTQRALLAAIRTCTNSESAEAPVGASQAQTLHKKTFGLKPRDHIAPLALVVRDNLSEGIDLDGGEPCVVHHDLSWNPARFDQRMGRITRASSGFWKPKRRDVFIPVMNLGLDERLYHTMANRSELADRVLSILPPTLGDRDA